jgi:hypothetical protein
MPTRFKLKHTTAESECRTPTQLIAVRRSEVTSRGLQPPGEREVILAKDVIETVKLCRPFGGHPRTIR